MTDNKGFTPQLETIREAALDMYAALYAFLSLETHIEDGVSPIIDMARAALAKAEGRG